VQSEAEKGITRRERTFTASSLALSVLEIRQNAAKRRRREVAHFCSYRNGDDQRRGEGVGARRQEFTLDRGRFLFAVKRDDGANDAVPPIPEGSDKATYRAGRN